MLWGTAVTLITEGVQFGPEILVKYNIYQEL
jgi:hypothetical protein